MTPDQANQLLEIAKGVCIEFEASNTAGSPTPGLWPLLLALDEFVKLIPGPMTT